MKRPLAWLLLAAWSAFWFWAFSFAWSDSFFRWNPGSRLPVFATAWLAAVAMPASASLQWARWRDGARSAPAALGAQILVSAASLGVMAAASFVLSRAPEPWHLSGDDAMGVGIDFLLLWGIAMTSFVALIVAMQLARRREARQGEAA